MNDTLLNISSFGTYASPKPIDITEVCNKFAGQLGEESLAMIISVIFLSVFALMYGVRYFLLEAEKPEGERHKDSYQVFINILIMLAGFVALVSSGLVWLRIRVLQ